MNTKLKHQTNILDVISEEAQDIALINADYKRAAGNRKNVLLETITLKVDTLLSRLLTNFSGDVPEDTKQLFSVHQPLTAKSLKNISNPLIPLVVMRELISVHEIKIDRQNLQNWKIFYSRYKNAII